MTDTHSAHLTLTPADGRLPLGFQWAATKAGIKASGNLDLALAVAPAGANAAVMYTKNQVVAAPVTVGREHIAHSKGRVHAVLINSGNANCATGSTGHRRLPDKLRRCGRRASAARRRRYFPRPPASSASHCRRKSSPPRIPAAIAALASDAEAAKLFARAIMTTDTKPKTALATSSTPAKPYTSSVPAKAQA